MLGCPGCHRVVELWNKSRSTPATCPGLDLGSPAGHIPSLHTDWTQHTCTAFRALRLAATHRQPRPLGVYVTAAVSVALCSAKAEPHCTAWTGRGSDPGVALIHHRYGNYHSVLSEPSPDPVLSEAGPPGDTDYKTLQLRVSLLQSPAQLSLLQWAQEEEDDKHLEMTSVSPADNSDVCPSLIRVSWTRTMPAMCVSAVVSPSSFHHLPACSQSLF